MIPAESLGEAERGERKKGRERQRKGTKGKLLIVWRI